jgi:lipopolysaccharide transport system permease protein
VTSSAKYHLHLSSEIDAKFAVNLPELWEYRELVFFLAWREISSRYRQAALGAAWAIIQPLATMVVFSIIFGRLAKIPSDGVPYPLFSYAALLPWQYFQTSTQTAANSLVTNTTLITKVYFPRLVIPLAAIMPGLLDLTISFLIFVFLMLHFKVQPSPRYVWLPLFTGLGLCAALGVGLWSSALCVKYRDIKHVIPFVMQLLLFASPVTYSSHLIPSNWRLIYALNPMVEVIDGFRWSCLGIGNPFGLESLVSILTTALLLVSGTYIFRRMERSFADII